MFFHALIFARSQGSCLDTRSLGRVFKHRPSDPASLNAFKQTCVIIILAYFTWFQPKPHRHKQVWLLFLHILPDFNLNCTENVAQTLKYPLFKQDFFKQNGVSVISLPQRQRRTQCFPKQKQCFLKQKQCFRKQKHQRNDQSRAEGRNAFLYNSCKQIRAQIGFVK